MYDLHDRILGSLLTAGMGDALGAPGEAMSREEILAEFDGHPIDHFMPTDNNFYCKGYRVGEVTDDTSQMYEMAKAVIETNGDLTVKAAADGLLRWADNYPRYYPRSAGPTTRYWVEEYRAGGDPVKLGLQGTVYGRGFSNGSAMRVAAAALIHPGDLAGAIDTTITMTKISHATQHAYAGTCAVSCAIAEALTENSTVDSVIKAALIGARKGQEIGIKEARISYGPAVMPKILTALNCVAKAEDPDQAAKLICDEVGCDGSIQTSAGVVLGLFVANDGKAIDTIKACANIGGDTDTFACIAGMIAGAYTGYSALPQDWVRIFDDANPDMDFRWVANELTRIAEKNLRSL
jgi:ADP-ribosylglycohydrolase